MAEVFFSLLSRSPAFPVACFPGRPAFPVACFPSRPAFPVARGNCSPKFTVRKVWVAWGLETILCVEIGRPEISKLYCA